MDKSIHESFGQSGDENQPDVTVDVHSDKEQEKAMDSNRFYKVSHLIIPVFLLETMVLLALAVLAYQLRFTDLFPAFERGFFVTDPSLQYPYKDKKGWSMQIITITVAVLIPILIFIIGEIGIWLFSRNPRKIVRASCIKCKIHLVPRRLIRIIGTFFLGLIISSIMVDMLKLLCCTHRPYFLSICHPNISNTKAFVTNESVCLSNDKKALREARMSFPSFHSTICGYTAFFTMIYLHYVASMRGTIVLRPVLLSTISGISILSSVSRYALYLNHWYDVVAGYIIGVTVAVYLTIGILQKFYEHEDISPKDEECLDDEEQRYAHAVPWQWIPRATYHGNKGIKYIHQKNKILKKKTKKEDKSQGPNQAFQQDLHRRLENLSRKASTDKLDSDCN